MEKTLLEVDSLKCVLKNGGTLFDDVSFRLNAGEAVLVEAGSGLGKSSLLYCIKGIETGSRTFSGRLSYMGRRMTAEDRTEVGLVLQNPHSQMLSTLVDEELKFGLELSGSLEAVSGSLYKDTIEILGLSDLLDKQTRQLSAGQKHMVAIGAIGVMGYPALMMDEPFLYLDPYNTGRVLDYIGYLREKGTGILVTSHPGVVEKKYFDDILNIRPVNSATKYESNRMDDNQVSEEGRRLIRLENVDIGYDNGVPIAEDISLTITSGRELWIFGENGKGKTTLLKTISGAVPPLMGRIETRGTEGTPRTFVITQNPDRFFFEPTIIREMVSPLNYANGDENHSEIILKEAENLLDLIDLGHKKHISPFQLSFGERIRLAAAQAALLKPDFLLVDDILAFLDERERTFLVDFLRELKNKTGCGLVFANSRLIPGVDSGKNKLFINGSRINGPDSFVSESEEVAAFDTGSGKRRKANGKRKLWRFLKMSPFEYVKGDSFVHRLNALVKLLISMLFWVWISFGGVAHYPYIALTCLTYFLCGGLGIRRFLVDSVYFVIQAIIFALFLPLIRWDINLAGEGALAGTKVWLFFIPIIVIMRTTTINQWMTVFNRLLSKQKRIVIGVSFGLLPCIISETKEILHVQAAKGYTLQRRDILRPRRFWNYLRSVLVPLIIIIEDMSALVGLSVKLRGYEE